MVAWKPLQRETMGLKCPSGHLLDMVATIVNSGHSTVYKKRTLEIFLVLEFGILSNENVFERHKQQNEAQSIPNPLNNSEKRRSSVPIAYIKVPQPFCWREQVRQTDVQRVCPAILPEH